MSRTKKSIKNVIVAVGTQVIVFCFSLTVRSLFLNTLGIDRLGYVSLFSNIVGVLSIADFGMFDVMCYFLYKPFANNQKETVIEYLRVFRKVFFVLGTALFCASMFVVPFLPRIIQGFQGGVLELEVSFILFSIMSFSTYYFANYRAVIFVEQNDYVLSYVSFGIKISIKCLQIIILKYRASFIAYIIAELICNMIGNIAIKKLAMKKHGSLFEELKEKQSKKRTISIQEVKNKVADIFVNRACMTAVAGTDNILLSLFFGTKILGILSNYTVIIGALSTLRNRVFSAFSASYGNYIVTCLSTEEARTKYREFSSATFILALSLYVGALMCINTFLSILFSDSYLVENGAVFVILFSFYLDNVANLPIVYGNISGKYKELHRAYIIWALTNLVFSIIMIRYCGYIGVYYGTVISYIVFYPLIEMRIVSEDLGGKYADICVDHLKRAIILVLTSFAVLIFQRYVIMNNQYLQLLVNLILAVIVDVLIAILFMFVDANWRDFLRKYLGRIMRR